MRTSDAGMGAMRLGLHHFAYLRAIAMGLDRVECRPGAIWPSITRQLQSPRIASWWSACAR